MFKFLALFALVLSAPAYAVSVSVHSTCEDSNWLESNIDLTAGLSVGGASIKAFDGERLAYVGSAAGISSIRETPVGNAAMEVISDTNMRAYGWCYEINGVAPDKMPDQVLLTAASDAIEWYFGFAEFKDGAWISYCTPTHQARPKFICP